MSSYAIPKVKRTAVFVKESSRNQVKYVRRPWDYVDLDFGTDNPLQNKRYIQIYPGSAEYSRAGVERSAVYDDIMFFDGPFAGDVTGADSKI